MIGLLPVNTEDVNGPGVLAVWHFASADAVASAVVVGPETTRSKIAAKVTPRAVATHVIVTQKDKVFAATAIARATNTRAAMPRNIVATVVAMARAIKIKASTSATRFAVPAPALARCFVAPAAALVNVGYLVWSSIVQCQAIATAHVNAIRVGHSAYTVASASAARAEMSARRTISASPVAMARSTVAASVRNRVLSASAIGSAFGNVLGVVEKRVSATAVARAVKVRGELAFMRIIGMLRPLLRVIATPPAMVTWMYVHEPDYRTVFVRNDASTTRMRTFRKQPAEILPYDIDFAEWLTPGDDIESAEVHVDAAVNGEIDDLTIENVVIIIQNPDASQFIAPVRVKVWLSGGVDGATYKITARCDTEGGRRKEVDFRLNTREV